MTDCERLVAKIAAQNLRQGEIVVSLEDFFIGNDDRGSIGCNLGDDQPKISAFYDILRAIRSRPEVQDVLVRICEYDNPNSWPYTDTVYIIASATPQDVRCWVEPLRPDEVYAGWMYGAPPNVPVLQSGMKPYSIWWD